MFSLLQRLVYWYHFYSGRRWMDMGRHRRLECEWCSKVFRSDYLQKHQQICKKNSNRIYDKFKCKYCSKEFRSLYWKKHEELCNKESTLKKLCDCEHCDLNCKRRIVRCYLCLQEVYIYNVRRHIFACKKRYWRRKRKQWVLHQHIYMGGGMTYLHYLWSDFKTIIFIEKSVKK